MKRLMSILLCLALLMALTACGETAAPAPTATPSIEETVAQIRAMAGQDVQDLIDLVGEPLSRDYSPSCLAIGGQDGELRYEGFTVYTLVDANGAETIYDVE